MYAEKEPKRSTQKRPPVVQQQKNKTGLPDQLKAGMESLSGMNLDHVRVHYNSPKPAAVQAHAYAQGSDIHLAPGQTKHLPHELGHVVQQAEGRVKPTTSVNGMAVNDSPSLEREADRMGARAMQMRKVANSVGQEKSNGGGSFGFVDNRLGIKSMNEMQLKIKEGIVQRTVTSELDNAKRNWQQVNSLHVEANDNTLPNYERSIRERNNEPSAKGLAAWTKSHRVSTEASIAELNRASIAERMPGVRGDLAPSVHTMSDVRIRSSVVDMAVEEKTSLSEKQGDIDALITSAHGQLGMPRSASSTGVTTRRICTNILNHDNPWPYTPRTIPAEIPSLYDLGLIAKERNLRNENGPPPDQTQVEVKSARFGIIRFPI